MSWIPLVRSHGFLFISLSIGGHPFRTYRGGSRNLGRGGFNTWKVMIIVTDRRMRAPTSAYGATSQRGSGIFFI
jgi:hypothetical protein